MYKWSLSDIPPEGVDGQDTRSTAGETKQGIVQVVLDNQRHLRRDLNKALTQLNLGEGDDDSGKNEETTQLLKSALCKLGEQDGLFSLLCAPEDYAEYCPPHAMRLAQRVFNVPELLEMILLRMSVRELLNVQLVNRQFRDAVDGSVQLQRKMSFVPHDDEAHVYSPFLEEQFPGFTVEASFGDDEPVTNLEDPEEYYYDVHARFSEKVPIVGERCRRMLLIQPPLVGVTLHMPCCLGHYTNDYKYDIEPSGYSGGVTIGDLLDAVEEAKATHTNCAHARPALYNVHDGSLKGAPEFQLCIHTYEKDPVFLAEKEKRIKQRTYDVETSDQRKLLCAWADICSQPNLPGVPMPSFAEFREAFVPDEHPFVAPW